MGKSRDDGIAEAGAKLRPAAEKQVDTEHDAVGRAGDPAAGIAAARTVTGFLGATSQAGTVRIVSMVSASGGSSDAPDGGFRSGLPWSAGPCQQPSH